MAIMSWNGSDVPEELKRLPAGEYVIQPVEEALALSPEEEEGIRRALRQVRDGQTVSHEQVQADIARILGK